MGGGGNAISFHILLHIEPAYIFTKILSVFYGGKKMPPFRIILDFFLSWRGQEIHISPSGACSTINPVHYFVIPDNMSMKTSGNIPNHVSICILLIFVI